MKPRRSLGLLIVLVASSVAIRSSIISAGTPENEKPPRCTGIHEITIQSQVLDETRVLQVRLPQGYDSGDRRYPVLVVLDSEWHFNLAAADVELLSECSYVQPHLIPQMIIVGITNVDRNRDFTPTHDLEQGRMKFPTSGGAAQFRRFLVDEVLPMVDRTFRTHPYRVLAGWSLGGLFTVDTLLRESKAFDAYLAISPSLWWDDAMTLELLAQRDAGAFPVHPKNLVVTLGSEEKNTMVANSTNEFISHLESHPIRNVAVELVPVEGLGHNFSPKMAFFLGLATLFSDWNPPASLTDQGLAAIDAYFAALTERYHFPIPVPEGLYGSAGWKLFEANQRDEACTVFQTWVERHPESPMALASLGAYYRESGDTRQAAVLLKRALTAEEQSAQPRTSFIFDLRREIEALSPEE